MSVAFVRQLRSRGPVIEFAPPGLNTITFRVQVAEFWEAVRVAASPETTIREVKERVVSEFYPAYEYHDEFVLKLHGWEVLDESAPIGLAGIVNGSIILLGDRRRRPVR